MFKLCWVWHSSAPDCYYVIVTPNTGVSTTIWLSFRCENLRTSTRTSTQKQLKLNWSWLALLHHQPPQKVKKPLVLFNWDLLTKYLYNTLWVLNIKYQIPHVVCYSPNLFFQTYILIEHFFPFGNLSSTCLCFCCLKGNFNPVALFFV